MKKYRNITVSLCVIISGCGGLDTTTLNSLSVDLPMIANEVNCELRDAVNSFLKDAKTTEERKKRDAWITDFTAQYELTLDNWQTIEANITSLKWSIPNFPSPITIGNTSTHSRRGENKYVTKFSTIKNLKSIHCIESNSTNKNSLRIKKTINDAWRTHTMNGDITPTSYSYQKSFNIIYDATVSPGFSIVNLEATTRLHGRNRSFNILDMDFNRKPNDASPILVAIQTDKGIPVLVLNAESQSVPVYTPVEQKNSNNKEDEQGQNFLFGEQLETPALTAKKPKENWQNDLLKAVKRKQKAFKNDAIQNRIEEQHNNNLRTLSESGEIIER